MATVDIDPNVFIDNLNRLWADAENRFPWEHVAWSLDGTQMLAHAPSPAELEKELERLGITDYIGDFLIPGDCVVAGAFAPDLLDEAAGQAHQ
jgi:hypothetical protein